MGVNRHVGSFFLSSDANSLHLYKSCIDALEKIYDVPRTTVTKRLSWLGLVIDTRKGLDHFSRLFSEGIPF